MRSTSRNSASSASRGLFQHLLDRLAARTATPPPDRVEPRLAVRLAETTPRFIVPNAALYDDDVAPHETFDAQRPAVTEPTETGHHRQPVTEPPLAARAAALREKVLNARSKDEVRQLRRVGARLLHPDVSPPHERAAAEKIMAELNAVIDAALRASRPRC